jgi:AcrR family transcriptional regulator
MGRYPTREGAMPPKTVRRARRGAESQQAILDATIAIAAERGYERTTIVLVSERSGLPASSIYWHFRNKDELFAAVIERGFVEWSKELERSQSVVQGAKRRERLSGVIERVVGSLTANPDFLLLGLMLSLERQATPTRARDMFVEVRARAYELIVDAILRELPAGTPDTSALAVARNLALLTFTAAEGLFIAAQVPLPGPDPAEMPRTLAAAVDLLIEEAIPGQTKGSAAQ